MLGEIAWLVIGLYWLGRDRRSAPDEENEWGVGQILPLILLLLPVLTMLEILDGKAFPSTGFPSYRC